MEPNRWIRSTKNGAALLAELPEFVAVIEAQGLNQDDLSMTKVPGENEVKKSSRKKKNQANQASGYFF